MKRSLALLIMLLLPSLVLAAGTCEVSSTAGDLSLDHPSPLHYSVTVNCTADAADGSFPDTTFLTKRNYFLYEVDYTAGDPGPLLNSDLTLMTDGAVDVLGGQGANLIDDTGSSITFLTSKPLFTTKDNLTQNVDANNVNSAVITLTYKFASTLLANVGPTGLTSADFGSFTCNGTTCTLDNSVVTPAKLASQSFGSFTCNGTDCKVAKTVAVKTSAYTLGTDSVYEAYGGFVSLTGVTTLTLPAVAVGMNFCVYSADAEIKTVDPNAADGIRNGTATRNADGQSTASAGAVGNSACFVADSADGWTLINPSGVWTDE